MPDEIGPEERRYRLTCAGAHTNARNNDQRQTMTDEELRLLVAEVVAAACIIDRSAGKADVGVPLVALAEYEVPAYAADNLPPELAAIPPIKPGSRNI